MENPHPPEVQQDLGHPAREEDAHGRVVRGPFGRTSTRRGTARFTRCQSATVGTRRPAAWAIAGRWRTRFVEPPQAAWTSIAFDRRLGQDAALGRAARRAAQRKRRAPGGVEPDGLAGGARAQWGRARPSASATTCAVAAVPRNWQPPPGEPPRGRRPPRRRRGSRGRGRAARRASAPCPGPRRPRRGASRRRARSRSAGLGQPASASIMAGRPLSQVATPRTPARRARSGSVGAGRSPRRCGTAGCRSSRASPACGRRTGRSSTRRTAAPPASRIASAAARTSRPTSQWPVW